MYLQAADSPHSLQREQTLYIALHFSSFPLVSPNILPKLGVASILSCFYFSLSPLLLSVFICFFLGSVFLLLSYLSPSLHVSPVSCLPVPGDTA